MDLVFFGSGSFGLPTLQHLAARHRIRAVVTQPDRPAGRGGKPAPTPIGAWAAATLDGAPLLKPERASAPAAADPIRAFPADAWVVIAFGQKLSRSLLAGRFAVNLHASLLPRWRGAAPINAAILAGDEVTGNSVITLADRMDAGLVLARSTRAIEPHLTAGDLHDLLAADGPPLVERVLAAHAAGTLAPVAQDESEVTIAPKLTKADGWVDFGEPAELCRRRLHGLNPWPAVTVSLAGEPLKLLRAESVGPDPQQPGPGAPGALADPAAGLVRCGGGTLLRLLEVQPAGRRAMPWPDFARGRKLDADARLIGGRAAC